MQSFIHFLISNMPLYLSASLNTLFGGRNKCLNVVSPRKCIIILYKNNNNNKNKIKKFLIPISNTT